MYSRMLAKRILGNPTLVPVVTAGVVAAAVISVPERHLFYELPCAIVKELAGGEKDVSELKCPNRRALDDVLKAYEEKLGPLDAVSVGAVNRHLDAANIPLTDDALYALTQDIVHSAQRPDDPAQTVKTYEESMRLQRNIAIAFDAAGEKVGAVMHTALCGAFFLTMGVVGASMDATKDSWYLRKSDNGSEHGGNSPPPTP